MPKVQLDDQAFKVAQRRAADGGYASVDTYIADVVFHDTNHEVENLDPLFSPERLAHIDKADTDIKAGKGYTSDEADEELAKRGREWLRTNPL